MRDDHDLERRPRARARILACILLGGCAPGAATTNPTSEATALAPTASVATTSQPTAEATHGASSTATASPAPTASAARGPAAPAGGCGAALVVASGDTLERISRRCYGSRAYADWIVGHNHHESKPLRAGETLEIPPFETLVTERLAPKWKTGAGPIAEAYAHFRAAEPEIEAQLRSAKPGMATYQPSARAKAELESAANALRPFAQRLEDAGVRTKKLAQATESFTALAGGSGHVSTDYATEDVHQCFYHGVEALR
ncbi:MAG TPA: hypothetical protein VL400_01975 [Polyangiaceae bacterium]|nr:hypothetical protein [Polyangiaceae bacterium]